MRETAKSYERVERKDRPVSRRLKAIEADERAEPVEEEN